ncbi:MAG: response regulator, partial [Desulfobacterales bacterium]|nr:response regulator [Desulfobacterales bacterium]
TVKVILKHQEDLREARDSAEFASKAKADFLANMSHEIRTPMNAIIGFSELALKTNLTPKQEDYLNKIQISSKSLLTILNDILDFSKIEAGKLEMEYTGFKIEEVINHISDLFAQKAHEKGVELNISISSDVPPILDGDPLRLSQILINFCSNSIKFTQKGEVNIRVTLLEKLEEKVKLYFLVKDTGIGMTKEHKQKLFSAFSQADTSTTRKFGGTGLGLVISKRLVEMMNGEISIESEMEKGSIFAFTAWFGLDSYKNNKKKEKNRQVPTKLKGLKVLVVDDNATAREILFEILNSFGFDVKLASSGEEALQEIKTVNNFQLIIMDWRMPGGIDGIETCVKINKEIPKDKVPFIVMVSAFDKDEVVKKAMEKGIKSFLSKPVKPSLLFDTIMNIFGVESAINKEPVSEITFEDKNIDKLKGAKVLLVEDNIINQQVAQELLSSFQIEVDIANNGKEGVEKFQTGTYNLIFMDVQMPIMDGYSATHEIRKIEESYRENSKEYKSIPIVALTAHAIKGEREKCISHGMDDYLTKPLDLEALLKALKTWIKLDIAPINESKPVEDLSGEFKGLNMKAALSRLGGKQEFYFKLLEGFYKNHSNATDEIRKAMENDDYELAERIAHTMKGVAGNIGADDLQEAAFNILEAFRNKKIDDINILIDIFDKNLQIVVLSISKFKNNTDNSEVNKDKLIPIDQVVPLLRNLYQYMENDLSEATNCIEALSPLIKGSSVDLEFNNLTKSFDELDIIGAAEAIKKISKILNINLE